uniref:Small ribosomal subunit protein uS3 n=1 Tax=uncultured korarchaeote TaxID=161241 RepID=A0A1L2JQ00_9CREN|nr:ribosomal protein S3 [uncultured korarchaeote]
MSAKASPTYKKIIEEGLIRARVYEFLQGELDRAGFHGAKVVSTPVRDVVTLYVERPGLVIGRGGRIAKRLTEVLKREFGFQNPYLRVEKVEQPFLSASIVANFIARRIMRGERHKRAAFAALRRVMASGAKGVEIRIAGKFTGQRAREERFRAGVIYRCGEDPTSYVDYAVRHVMLPQGMLGIRVRIVKPVEATALPDQVIVLPEKVEEALAGLSGEKEVEVAEVPSELLGESEGESESEEGVEEDAGEERESGGTEEDVEG